MGELELQKAAAEQRAAEEEEVKAWILVSGNSCVLLQRAGPLSRGQ